ncbi:hypothetical protein KRR55_06035 [Paeniglutamicibacter sp. ABSL32-1]|uniref:hypothetical protein n=1 Tax=Paeniglutamicibacter quisquiliarum TaxID=2849498 RepID=UPI001C2D0B5A|nr:hypothetical protein [Paeniglutamicibacter quisquiliarum]MBV1778671.1 hypothetical protein [Paeniglutamicibacter quisquiliarum]
MDKSTDGLISNVFESRIREADRITREFKSPQVTSGASGQLGYSVENAVDWDRTDALTYTDPFNPPYNREATYTITFTGDGSHEHPYAIPQTDIRINGTGEANKIVYGWNYSAWIYGDPPSVWVFELNKPVTSSFNGLFTMQWKIRIMYNLGPTVRIKLRAIASCPGTLTIVRDS